MYTHHCRARNQQRNIPPVVHQWLSNYGQEIHDGSGAIKVYFNRKSMREMERDFGRHFIQENKKYLKVYRVESLRDGRVITAGWLTGRIKRH